MSSIVIAGNTSGSVTLQAPAIANATVLTLPATTATIATTDNIYAASLGYGQTWQSFTSTDRKSGITYYNTTGKPIYVSAAGTSGGNGSLTPVTLIINTVTIQQSATYYSWSATPVGLPNSVGGLVPPSGSYSITMGTTSGVFTSWAELR